MSSFIETTLPPGYGIDYVSLSAIHWSSRRDRLHGWWWSTFTVDGEHSSVGYDTKAECYRAAWQHWTATVLRKRDIRWYGETEGLNKTAWFRSERLDVQVCRYFGDHTSSYYQGALEVT
ncbi:MAG TPA: hypothetical protein VJ553_03520, partial [Candidatus Paceibacterota bacterium]|nr:hypothetical protein [Candidatus Paceibacterota bacterium]